MLRGEKQPHTAKARRCAKVVLFSRPQLRGPSRASRLRGVLLFLVLTRSAWAAGIGIPDLGAGGLGQAGATIARPADLTALYYNPAALAWLEGIQLYADVRAIDHRVSFQRLDAQGQNPSGWLPVENG